MEEGIWKKAVKSLATFIINNLPTPSDEDLEDKVLHEFVRNILQKITQLKKLLKIKKIFSIDNNKQFV